ncbi:little elongation complex subunit 1 isoform X2 [Erinaceus europaeus]|uniref:Little elongation complex subunit 1 isoform X2 n=1 Tax=Erinaceus europaeus TaxID=9365 RepID=A0ABM3XE67_ERIEU|nr:little elongation complex subunit 1 isoform X2 [Erinaceus europaeus]
MMPGETHPAAPGTAADLARCQGCASLQQNLNEYVDALITLKQKIINTDNLLTEYQKKSAQLQFARRENSTLHRQVEQMLQKVSPLQQCQEELGTLRAELEEKKNSLKVYQHTHQEYTRVREECLRTDAQKKKLEAKVKKLEEAAAKQTQDFKQLRTEKKILEKQFKETQERLDGFSRQKKAKELRHIGTQISNDACGSIDKRKVRLLLQELWLCFNTTHGLPGGGGTSVPEKFPPDSPSFPAPRPLGSPSGSPSRAGGPGRADVQTCPAQPSVQVQGGFSPGYSGRPQAPHLSDDGRDLSDPEAPLDRDLQAAVDFFRLPPPLLSPVPSPPPPPSALAAETYFSEDSDSSEEDSDQHGVPTESASEDEAPGPPGAWAGCGPQEGEASADSRTFSAAQRAPLPKAALALEEPWAQPSEPTGAGQMGLADKAELWMEAREPGRSVQPPHLAPGLLPQQAPPSGPLSPRSPPGGGPLGQPLAMYREALRPVWAVPEHLPQAAPGGRQPGTGERPPLLAVPPKAEAPLIDTSGCKAHLPSASFGQAPQLASGLPLLSAAHGPGGLAAPPSPSAQSLPGPPDTLGLLPEPLQGSTGESDEEPLSGARTPLSTVSEGPDPSGSEQPFSGACPAPRLLFEDTGVQGASRVPREAGPEQQTWDRQTPCRPASLLPNQVSVITTQRRPKPPRPRTPEVSTSCRKLDFESSSDPCSLDQVHYPASRLFSFLSEHFPLPAREPPTTPDMARTAGGDAVRPGSRTPGRLWVSPGSQHSPQQPRPQKPGLASPRGPGAPDLPPAPPRYTGLREQGAADTELESEAPSGSEGEAESEGPAAGMGTGTGTGTRPSLEVGSLTSALQDWDIGALSDTDRLSASEVATCLESCRLRDASSGDSVLECSSRGTRCGSSGRLESLAPAAEQGHRPDSAEGDWAESEEDECSQPAGQLSPRSLRRLRVLLRRLGRELRGGRDGMGALLLHLLDGLGEEPGSPPRPAAQPPTGPAEDPPSPMAAGATQTPDKGLEEEAAAPEEEAALLQCQISTVTSEVISVVVSRDQDLVIQKGDHCTIINGLALDAGGQLIVCGASSDPGPGAPEPTRTPPPASPPPCAQDDISSSGQAANFDKRRLRLRPVRPSVRISADIFQQDLGGLDSPPTASDHTYCHSRPEPARARARPRPPGRPAPAPRAPTLPVLATADTSTPTDGADLARIRREVGAPLPPLLAPLVATPPRAARSASPVISSSSPASPPAPAPAPEDSGGASPPASPLQFCAATPKHALPVPGRLPPRAPAPAPPESSVRILDTMYPELSARARTLSILKGNLQLPRAGPAEGLSCTPTAFVKAGDRAALGDGPRAKRPQASAALRSAKRLRLDCGSPEPELQPEPQPEVAPETVETHDRAIGQALSKLAEAAFDLLPVIRSHVYVGSISRRPVMRDPEKQVVHEFSTTKKHLAECLLRSILAELSAQRASREPPELPYAHALCRVYIGVCRQLGDLERARLLCYSLLKEDFPESEKLTLFVANMWQDVFLSPSVVSTAMQLVARQRARGEVLNCLRALLSWEKNAPMDVGLMVSKLLLTVQLCPETEFQPNERFGDDLSDSTWEHIFAIDLLCCHQKWVWTHDNIISKELWPVMDKWIKYRKGHANIAYTPDIIVASILRLIGRLGQLGLKEGFPAAVRNISSVIGMFIQFARQEDIPWGVQLAAVYALCDLSPSNPTEIFRILEAWRKDTPYSVPAAVEGCLEEVGSLCAEEQEPG